MNTAVGQIAVYMPLLANKSRRTPTESLPFSIDGLSPVSETTIHWGCSLGMFIDQPWCRPHPSACITA